MPVNDSELDFYKQLAKRTTQNSQRALIDIPISELRASISSTFILVNELSKQAYLDESVLTRDGCELPIRIYNSQLSFDTETLIYFMGNGYLFDLFDVNALICARIAKHSCKKVVLVSSRLTPETAMPIPIYDAFDAIQAIAENPLKYCINRELISLAGYCTGATCAAAVTDIAHRANAFKINQLILLNGIYDLTHANNDYLQYENEDVSFSAELLEYIIQHQGMTEPCKRDKLYSPIFNDRFDHFPKTTLIVAEFDRNRSSSEAYYGKLNEHNVDITKILLEGQTHNTIIFHNQIANSLDPAAIIADTFMKA